MQKQNRIMKGGLIISTDASYHPTWKVGSYAFYIITNSGKHKRSGVFIKEPIDSTEAEVKAIGKALDFVLTSESISNPSWITINTDSIVAIKKINNPQTKEEKKVNKLLKAVIRKFSVTTTENFPIEFRHIKAHKKSRDPRSWINDWCDKAAKKNLNLAIKNKIHKLSTLNKLNT